MTHKELEIRKEQISSLEMKKPPGIFRTGYLKIALVSGEILQLGLAKNAQYERVLRLIQSFDTEVFKLV